MLSVQIDVKGRPCLFVGAGAVAERRIDNLMKEGASIIVLSPHVTDQIRLWAEEGLLTWIEAKYEEGQLPEAFMVFVCTDDEDVNEACATEARSKGALVNRGDRKDDCDFTMPAQVVLGDLKATLSTANSSPRINRLLRMDFEERYAPIAEALPSLKAMRDEVKLLLPSSKEREAFWQNHVNASDIELIIQGRWRDVEEKIRREISSIRAKS